MERVQVEEIEKVQTKAVDKGYLDFRIRGKENGKSVKIVVAVVQESGAKFVSAALKRLIEYQKFDMTRGCLVRSQVVKPNSLGKQYLDRLLSKELAGEFVNLAREDIKPLLAIYFVNKARTDYDVTEDQILEFIVQKKLATENYLICEILSDPSGQIPDGLVDENEIAESTFIPDTTEINNLDEALDNLLGQISG